MHLVNAAALEQWGSLTDDQVVSQILAGQTALFEVLMRRHNERLYRAARAILRDEAEAEDVIQQAYVNAYAHLRQFDGRSAFATWLTRIAVNEAIGRARRRGQYQPVGDGEITLFPTVFLRTPPDPEKQAFTHEIRVVLEAAVDALPDGYRVVFMLREIEGLSTAETARCLGVNENVVKTRLLRARAALRRDLTERVGEAATRSFAFLRPRCDRVVAAVLARIWCLNAAHMFCPARDLQQVSCPCRLYERYKAKRPSPTEMPHSAANADSLGNPAVKNLL